MHISPTIRHRIRTTLRIRSLPTATRTPIRLALAASITLTEREAA